MLKLSIALAIVVALAGCVNVCTYHTDRVDCDVLPVHFHAR